MGFTGRLLQVLFGCCGGLKTHNKKKTNELADFFRLS